MATQDHFLIINQHGDNRGDESALRGMIHAIRQRFAHARFTVIHQFAAAASEIHLENTTYLPMRMPVTEAVRLSIWAALAFMGIRLPLLPGTIGRRMLKAYHDAEVVISAPGGPYFGDLYKNHELVHWFYIWLARAHRTPVFLYQPSSGPFENALLRPIRKFGFRCFDCMSVREAISAEHIERLIGTRPDIGSDSALHQKLGAAEVKPGLVTGTFRNPSKRYREAHDKAAIDAMVELTRNGRRTLLLPQLHGTKHRDRPYLLALAAAARAASADVEVATETMSSDEQRSLVAASDLVLAGRYHPLVFAVSAGVPALVIPYEHKALGMATAAGIADYTVTLEDLESGCLLERLRLLLDNLAQVRQVLSVRGPALQRLADATADRLAEMVTRGRQ